MLYGYIRGITLKGTLVVVGAGGDLLTLLGLVFVAAITSVRILHWANGDVCDLSGEVCGENGSMTPHYRNGVSGSAKRH